MAQRRPTAISLLTNDTHAEFCLNVQMHNGIDDFALIFMEVSFLITLSHLFHMVLKHFGQPSAVSQMLAGVFMGRTFLSRMPYWERLFKTDDDDHLTSMSAIGRMFFMFLVGLEIDVPYLRRTFHTAAIVAYGGASACCIISFVAAPFIYEVISAGGNVLLFTCALSLVLSNTASPVLIRMVTELKLTMTEVGRLAISAALVNDITCLVIVALMSLTQVSANSTPISQKILAGLAALALLVGSSWGMQNLVNWMNRRYEHRRSVGGNAVGLLMVLVITVSCVTELLGYHSMMATFVLGVMFPRNGPTARTIVAKLTYAVHNFILPIYFGYAGVQTDLVMLQDKKVLIPVIIIIFLGTTGKVIGTIGAAKYLKMPVQEGLVLGFLLNVKGHVDLIVVSLTTKHGIWGKETYMALLITVLINSITAGPAAAYVVRRERRAIQYRSRGLEWLNLESELRVLTCVHSPHDIPTILDLIEISSGIDRTPLAPYLMHLIELTQRLTTNMLYNQIQDEDYDEDMGGDNARQINAAVDAFINETGINLRQLTAISRFASMHEDLCNGAQDVRASLIIVPYHRRQRFDGKMGVGKDGIRGFNINVLRHAPCTVGILVDRGMGAAGGRVGGGAANAVHQGSVLGEQTLHHVVVLFFGGPDDREAVAYGGRLAMHPCVSVTVVRFVPAFKKSGGMCVGVSHGSSETLVEVDSHADEVFMAGFYDRFVSTGMVTYVERLVENSAETVTALASMEGMYSLFMVGRQRQGPTAQLTTGMSEWEECPELGAIGDLLASSDFMLNGSVLVVQQHDVNKMYKSKKEEGLDDEFML